MERPDTKARLKRHRRAVLLAMSGCALLGATLLIGTVFALSFDSFEKLAQRHFMELSKSASDEVHSLLEPAGPILQECLALADQGDLPVDDPEKLGPRLAARLRSQKNLAWLSYSDDATGRFVGARRATDGAIVINRSNPKEDGGRPREWLVSLDGSQKELDASALKAYDPRAQTWYQRACAQPGVFWTRPFTFHEGARGITAAAAYKKRGEASPRGVFTADFFLDDLARFLEGVVDKRSAYAFLLERDGTEIVTARSQAREVSGPLIKAAVLELKQGPIRATAGAPSFRKISQGAEAYYASFDSIPVSANVEWVFVLIVPWQELSGANASHMNWTTAAWWCALALGLSSTLWGFWSLRKSRLQLEAAGFSTTFNEKLAGQLPADPRSPAPAAETHGNIPVVEVPAALLARAQDLRADKVLSPAPRVSSGERIHPALAGIPLLARIGQGAMGSVYWAYHPRLKTEVAVKVLSYILAEQEPEWVQRFYREAQVAAMVKSPHLVGVYDVNEDNGLYYLVMEYVRGRNAGEYARALVAEGQGALNEREALELTIAATTGLAAAHAGSVVHRDIKPDNILIPFLPGSDTIDQKRAKLADLGLARIEHHRVSLTDTRFTMGTVGYMSPEQALSFKEAGKPADVFSMGATLYDLLSGAPPFLGTSPFGVMTKTVEKPHEPIRNKRPEISVATAELLDKCLEKNYEDRYQSADELLAALTRCLERLDRGMQ
ncbi:MAG: serine/threonine protein kinase [Planctomycetes bacterium]|nr:serine/threonine protein kinase [Planctomycetota bacterium]